MAVSTLKILGIIIIMEKLFLEDMNFKILSAKYRLMSILLEELRS